MESKRIEIDGEVFDLSDPDGKRAAVRAWLKARTRERRAQGQEGASEDIAPAGADTAPQDPVSGDD
jgi:hypothetical protein